MLFIFSLGRLALHCDGTKTRRTQKISVIRENEV